MFIAFLCSSTDYGYAGFPGRTSPGKRIGGFGLMTLWGCNHNPWRIRLVLGEMAANMTEGVLLMGSMAHHMLPFFRSTGTWILWDMIRDVFHRDLTSSSQSSRCQSHPSGSSLQALSGGLLFHQNEASIRLFGSTSWIAEDFQKCCI